VRWRDALRAAVPDVAAGPSPPVSFDGLGYHFRTPAGWALVPSEGTWQEGDHPDIHTPGLVDFFAPNDAAEIAIGRRPTFARGEAGVVYRKYPSI